MPQRWNLTFDIRYTRLDNERRFENSPYDLMLRPIDENNSQGELTFEIEADTIDTEEAKAIGKAWVQSNLIDSYLMALGEVLKPEFRDPTLLNASELGSIATTGHHDTAVSVAVRAAPPVADFERAFELRRRLVAHSHREQLERSIRWFSKVRDSYDIIDQFVAQWIAFNVLYDLFNVSRQSDTSAINNLINAHPHTAMINQILADYNNTIAALASQGLTSRDGQRNYSNELKNLIGGQDVRSTLKAIGLCLWRVRNDIFHGGATSDQDRNFTRQCLLLLETIYRNCFCEYLGLA